MVRARRPRKASTAMASAADHDELRESGRQLTRLTGGVADMVALLDTELADHDRHRLLRGHDGLDPAPALTTASRELTELRQSLEAAERPPASTTAR